MTSTLSPQTYSAQSIATLLTERLKTLSPVTLEVVDESHQHAGHAGVGHHGINGSIGGSHFAVRIASPQFVGQPLLACHRMVMTAAGDLMPSPIHALRVQVIR